MWSDFGNIFIFIFWVQYKYIQLILQRWDKLNNKKNEDKFIIKKEKNTNRRIIIRTTDEMADEIFSIAKENGVSVNNLLISCIRYALDHR